MALIDREKLTKTINERLDGFSKKKKPVLSSYQRYFDGYTTYTVKKKNGKGVKTIRIYTDDYYTHDCSDRAWVMQKLAFGILTAISIALLLLAALGPSATVTWTPLAVPASLTVAAMIIYAAYLLFYITSPRLMTHWTQTHYHKFVLVFAFITWTGLGLTALLNLIYLIFIADGAYMTEVVSTLEYAASGAALFLVWYKEKNTDYCTVENDAEIPEYAQMVISYK